MASTNKTVNYELSQFEGTDKPSWEADYNADMLAIDTNLKAVSDVANGASGDISTLDGRLTTAEGNISTNANDIDALEGRADALEAGQTSDDSRLDALEAEQIMQNTAIESNTRLGYNLARPYDSASTYAVGAYVLFQDTLYKCTTAVSTGEAFDPNKWLAIKATDEIAAGGYTLPGYHHYSASDIATISNVRLTDGTSSINNCSIRDAYSIANILFVIIETTIYGYQIGTASAFSLQADLTFTPIVEVDQGIQAISQSISAVSGGLETIGTKKFENRNPSSIGATGVLTIPMTAIDDGTAFPNIKIYTSFALPLTGGV